MLEFPRDICNARFQTVPASQKSRSAKRETRFKHEIAKLVARHAYRQEKIWRPSVGSFASSRSRRALGKNWRGPNVRIRDIFPDFSGFSDTFLRDYSIIKLIARMLRIKRVNFAVQRVLEISRALNSAFLGMTWFCNFDCGLKVRTNSAIFEEFGRKFWNFFDVNLGEKGKLF